MTEYTPGPWNVEELYEDEWFMPAHEVRMVGERNELIAVIPGTANARLIAAAPDMLEALEAMMVMPWGYCACPVRMGDMEGEPDDAHCGECRDSRTAIAKAKGE